MCKYDHESIVKAVRKLNPKLKVPNRTSWKEGIPDLEEPLNHIAIEIELSSLRNGWAQCLYYYRMGAPEVHFILSPRLYKTYEEKEISFVKDNPIPNVIVYSLPAIIREEKKEKPIEEPKRKHKAIKLPKKEGDVEKFVIPPQDERKRIREPLIKLSVTERRIGEDKVYEPIKEKIRSRHSCPLCGSKMKQTTYTNNFGDKTNLFECSICGKLDGN